MNTLSNAMPDSSLESHVTAPGVIPASRRFYWAVRRELWETRSIYIAPLAVAALIVLASLISAVHLPTRLRLAMLDVTQLHRGFEEPYTFAALLLMATTIIVGVFYCLEALYGERRDRSILFWKSLPVSDLTTVLAKASIPIIVLPLLTFAITVVTQIVMLLIASARLMGTGLSLWGHVSLPEMWSMLLFHLVAVHALGWAPFWGWLLLVSAWARRAPLLWATLPPLAIGLVEKIAFNTTHFAHLLQYQFGGPDRPAPSANAMSMNALTPAPAQFLTDPSFWIGLAVAALFLALAVRLRRYREPI